LPLLTYCCPRYIFFAQDGRRKGGVPEAEVVENWQFIPTCIIVLPSLSAIKYTVTDNKTANINDKNCSLSIVLTSMDQKQQKS